jgi:hypothetical protein
MRVLVGTPTYNGQLTTPFATSLLALAKSLGPSMEWATTNGTLVAFARNVLASRALEQGYSHLLFVDSDVSFQPELVQRMIEFDQPVVGAAYPQRTIDQHRFFQQARARQDPNSAWATSLSLPMALETPHVSRGDFYRAESVPAGLMLIKREALEKLKQEYPDLYRPVADSYYEYQGLTHVLQCFDAMYDPNGVAIGEDLSFCRRWRAAGGELWTIFDDTVGHFGPFLFRARL